MTGDTGAQGPTLVGPSGPAGRRGYAGVQGATGATGAQGSTTTGPAGATGAAGYIGQQATTGAVGAQGGTQDGVAGAAGPAGDAGAQGPIGATGAQGPVGIVAQWTLYRDMHFDENRSDLQSSELRKVSEIARYVHANPSLKIGLEASQYPNGSDPRSQDLSDRRVTVVRDALINAGVPRSRIQTGAFGDTGLTHERRVAVLICTAN